MACFTHSFTSQPFAEGDAVLSLPLSTSSITAFTASVYFDSFNNSRLPHASVMSDLSSIYPKFCANISQIKKKARILNGLKDYADNIPKCRRHPIDRRSRSY